MARHLAGQTYCQRYLREKQKPKKMRNEAAMNADRDQALKALKTSVQLQEEKWVKTDPMPAPLIETKLLLAELLLEGGDAKAAAAQFQDLVDAINKSKPNSLNEIMLRIFRGAVRAYVEINDLEKAELAGIVLIDLGPDVEYVNDALLRFARLLEKKRKEAEAAVIAAVVPAEVTATKNRVAAMNELLGKLLMKLALRDHVSPVGMVWIAETSSAVGQDKAAETQCERFLKRIKKDAAFRKSAGPNAPTRIRTLLVHILGKTGQFQAALDQVTKLVAEHPTALEPRLEECRLRHSWATKDENQLLGAQRVSEALRTSLDRITGKKPSEYYEVVYIEADSFYMQGVLLDKKGAKAEAADAAKKGQQILRAALFSKPDLDGPDRVAQYRDLLSKFDRLQGRTPAGKKPEN
jgi:tetratricopeptide (TPR) repeat protein